MFDFSINIKIKAQTPKKEHKKGENLSKFPFLVKILVMQRS